MGVSDGIVVYSIIKDPLVCVASACLRPRTDRFLVACVCSFVPTALHSAACVCVRTALARGVRAPASTLTAVREKLPDTGYDEKKEPSTLHAPSATSSCTSHVKKGDHKVRC